MATAPRRATRNGIRKGRKAKQKWREMLCSNQRKAIIT
jgi:hypothetical protein